MDDNKTSNLHDKVKKKRFCRACNSRHSDNQIESDSDPHMLVELSGLKTRGDKAVNCRSQQIFLQSYLLLARLLPLQHIFLPTFQEPPLLHTSQSPPPRLAPITNLTGKLPPSDPALVYLPVLNWSKAFTVSYLSIIANPCQMIPRILLGDSQSDSSMHRVAFTHTTTTTFGDGKITPFPQ
jgi:hypothetical protein